MTIPLLGLTYCVSGAVYIFRGLLGRGAKPLVQLGSVILVLAAFNVYVEEWTGPHGHSFIAIAILLIMGFIGTHTQWSIALMRRVAVAPRRSLFSIAFLPIVWILSASVVLLLPGLETWENPPLAVYTFIVFICVLHVPCFAAGKTKALKAVGQRDRPVASSSSFLWDAFIALIAPTLVTLFVQLTARDDWRLFSLNIASAAANLSLVAITKPHKTDMTNQTERTVGAPR